VTAGVFGLIGATVGAGAVLLGGWLQHRYQVKTMREERREVQTRAACEALLKELLDLQRSMHGVLRSYDVRSSNVDWRREQGPYLREIEMATYLIPVPELRSQMTDVITVIYHDPAEEPLGALTHFMAVAQVGIDAVTAYLRGDALPPLDDWFLRSRAQAVSARQSAP